MLLGGTHDRVDHRHEADVLRILQADQSRIGAARVLDRDRAFREQARRLQLLATEADHHGLAAEVGIQRDIADGANWDVGARRVNRHAAAIGVLQSHYVIDVGILRQQFLLDALDRKLHHARHALHGGGDRQDVAGADAAVRIAVALEGVALQCFHRRRLDGGNRQAFQLARGRHVHIVLGQPAAGRQIFGGKTNGDVVADHAIAFGKIAQRHLVALRDRFQQRQTVGEYSAGRKAAVVDDNGDVVVVVHKDVARAIGAGRRGHLAFLRCFLVSQSGLTTSVIGRPSLCCGLRATV